MIDDTVSQQVLEPGGSGGQQTSVLRRAVERIEQLPAADGLTACLSPLADRLGRGATGAALRGQWLGHALHPLLTDFPLGCWMSASLIDLTRADRSGVAARRLVGLGLLATPLTAAAGAADWGTIEDTGTARVGGVHAAGNTVMALCYFASWRARRRHRHLAGALWALGGGTLGWVTGYLGGHLSFVSGVRVEAAGDPSSGAGDPVPLGI